MKKTVLLAAVLVCFFNSGIAQYYDDAKNEKFKGRVLDMIETQAENLLTHGYNVYEDYLELQERLQTSFLVQNKMAVNGQNLYAMQEGVGFDSNRPKAHQKAMNWATLKIAHYAISNFKSFIEPMPANVEETYIFGEYFNTVPEDVSLLYQLLKNTHYDYIHKMYRSIKGGTEVSLRLFYERQRLKVYANFTEGIYNEMEASSYFRPKDEFETNQKYIDRLKSAEKFESQLFKKYENKLKTAKKSNEQTETATLKDKIRDSYKPGVPLKIDRIGAYNPEAQTLPFTINGQTENLKIAPDMARRIKNNQNNLMVTGDKQLAIDAVNPEFFNIKITEPESGFSVLFGKQKSPLYIDMSKKTPATEPGIKESTATSESGTPQKAAKFLPPLLKIENLKFREENADNRINANERVFVDFTLKNYGRGQASDLDVYIRMYGDTIGLKQEPLQNGGVLTPGGFKSYTIPLNATMKLKRGKVVFNIKVREKNGFDSDPVELIINTLEFQEPKVEVVDHEFFTDDDKAPELGLITHVKTIIQNTGQGIAEDVNVYFTIPKVNVFNVSENGFSIGELKSGESREIIYKFVANKKYTYQNIPVNVTLSEKYRQFAQNAALSAKMLTATKAPEKVEIVAEKFQEKKIEIASLTPDVDKNIPYTSTINNNMYVLVIGNEDYSSQFAEEIEEFNATFAENDAQRFSDYAAKTLGVPQKNITLLINATVSEINQGIAELATYGKVFGEKAELMLYYAGHGTADPETKEAWIIPVDAGNDLKYAVKVNDIYKKLTEFDAGKVTVFLDASFSGGARNKSLFNNQGVVFGANQVVGNLVEFTACSGAQVAQVYREKQHGLFTYFLLKALQTHKGNISYKQLNDYLTEHLPKTSQEAFLKLQEPKINVSPDVEGVWPVWLMK